MKNIVKLLPLLLLVSCSEKKSDNASDYDFADKVITFSIENQSGEYLELPELYDVPVNFIPNDADEHSILGSKLETRGYKRISIERTDEQLLGRKTVTLKLTKGDCQCDVQKIYVSTYNISQYLVSERIRCQKLP